MRKRLVFKKEK